MASFELSVGLMVGLPHRKTVYIRYIYPALNCDMASSVLSEP